MHATLHRCSIDVFREKVCAHLFGRLLAECDLAFSDHRLLPEEHCVDVLLKEFDSEQSSQRPKIISNEHKKLKNANRKN